MNIEQYIIEIKNQLKHQGYAGKKIDYEEFKKLHQIYGTKMTEKEFAENVLEMTYNQYFELKKNIYKAVILKNQLSEIIQQDIEEIKNKLGLDGYSGKLIDYSELQQLHQKYGSQMPEEKFAKHVLDLNDTSYIQVKSGKRKVFILKSLQNKALEEVDKIQELLIQEGYAEKLIDYAELQKLHQTYGKQMTETIFAQKVLELGSTTYLEMKNHGVKAKILKKVIDKETKENIERIKAELERQGYVGKSIDYTEFQRVYQMYGNQMPEYKFAREVLEISESTYKTNLKKRNKKAIILKSLVNEVTSEEITRIKEELKSKGYVGKLIDYAELQRLHQTYGNQMPEYKFAQDVLEITASLYGNIKRSERKKARILKKLIDEVSQEDIESIQSIFEAKGFSGMFIDYSELQKLHKKYCAHMEEDVFAKQILEIPGYTYSDMKDGRLKTQILCHNKKVKLIHSMLLNESRWYTKEELELICKQNGISIDKIIRQIISNGTDMYNGIYKKVLEEKGKLWIGRTPLSDDFIEQNVNIIIKLARSALYSVKGNFGISSNSEDDDLIQDAIIWLYQNGGEIEKNFIDYPDIMQRKIFNTIRKGISINVLITKETKVKTTLFYEKIKHKMKLETRYPHDFEDNIIEMVDIEAKVEIAKKCIQYMKEQIDTGESKQIILRNAQEMFGLSKDQLLEIMQNYLNTKGRISSKSRRYVDFEEEK